MSSESQKTMGNAEKRSITRNPTPMNQGQILSQGAHDKNLDKIKNESGERRKSIGNNAINAVIETKNVYDSFNKDFDITYKAKQNSQVENKQKKILFSFGNTEDSKLLNSQIMSESIQSLNDINI